MAMTLEPTPDPPRFKVRATQLGYYDDVRRREGDVFWVSTKKNDRGGYVEFSETWMQRVPDNTPERFSTGQQERRQQHEEILASKQAGGSSAAASPRSPLDDE